jgi:hypothetical protein
MQRIFLLVAGLACACAPGQSDAQVKPPAPGSATGLQNGGGLDMRRSPDPRGVQMGTNPGKQDPAKANLQTLRGAQGGTQSTDKMGETSTANSLRVQMYMDRYNKNAATTSNVLRKQSQTSSDITRNMK